MLVGIISSLQKVYLSSVPIEKAHQNNSTEQVNSELSPIASCVPPVWSIAIANDSTLLFVHMDCNRERHKLA